MSELRVTGEELTTRDRIMRGAGGVVGAYSVRGTVDDITEAVTSQVKNIKPPSTVAEAITAEGVRVPVQAADDALTVTQMEARAAKDISGRRSLEAHEANPANPKLGHTIEQHIGKSENWLRARLEREPNLKFASSFRNEQIANRAQGQFFKQNRDEIEKWSKSGDINPFTGKIDMGESTGIVVERGKGGAVETTKAYFVIKRDNSPQGWHFRTSFPTK